MLSTQIKSLDETFCRYYSTQNIKNVLGITEQIQELLREKHGDVNIEVLKEYVKIRLKVRIHYMNSEAGRLSLRNSKKAKQYLK